MAAPRLLDLHGTGAHSAIVRHDDGTWRAHRGHQFATPVRLAITKKAEWLWAAGGDFDGDGKEDVLLRRADGPWTYYPMDGGNVLDAGRGRANLTKSLDWRPVGVGDLNDDGRDDLLLRRNDGAWVYYAMNGRRVIAKESGWANLPRSLDWRMTGVGDIDGDGRDDVLLRHISGSWRLYSMAGRRIVPERTTTPAFADLPAWRFTAIGDFDADGRDDILLRHTGGRWRYSSLIGDAVVHASPALTGNWAWRMAGVGDLDGEGGDDILLRHRDGRWRSYTALAERTAAATPDLPGDLDWRIATRPVHLPDPALRAAVHAALGSREGEPITRRALSGLTELEANAVGVKDLTGISLATGLRTLSLFGYPTLPASDLPGILAAEPREGPLHRTIEGAIEDLTALVGLTQLNTLRLSGNRISELSPLSALNSLEWLELSSNRVEDISPLSALHRLGILWLSHNQISDLEPLATLRQLWELGLDSNNIEDLGPLSDLHSLRNLRLGWNDVEDAAPIANLRSLTSLRLNSNRLTDIAPLSRMRAMRWLWLDSNAISDVAPLSEMRDLTRLHLESNAIADISPLHGLTALEVLILDDNTITDIRTLASTIAIRELGLARNRIAEISALRDLREVRRLRLAGNEIVDVSPLEFLTQLDELDLSHNRIVDIAPLFRNTGLGDGDRIDLRGNPLSDESLTAVVAALVDRGARVETPVRLAHDLVIHDDVVAILPIVESIAAETAHTGLPFREYAAHFYSHFRDEFDFLMFFSNLDDISDHQNARYYGLYQHVRNDVEGTGHDTFYDSSYRSRERLKGVIHFPWNRALMNGPALHEILHAWANFAIPTAVSAHWGFSSANGQLGGFDLANLEELGEGRYSAGRFGTFANGGNGPSYSPIELYFAGYLPPEEVPDLWVAEDGQWVTKQDGTLARTDAGSAIFEAKDVSTYTIDDIVARNGPRVPAMGEAQWNFRAALILLTDDDHPATQEQLDLLKEHAAWFSHRGNDDRPRLHNFHEATQGRGSITLDGLTAARKAAASIPSDLPASFGQIPPAHASLIDGTCIVVNTSREGDSPSAVH